MKNSIRFFVGFSLIILIMCYGCGVPSSEKEMKEAQQAMDNAKNLFADELAPTDWNEAIQSWEQAQGAVKEGKPAKTYFLRAKNRFEKTAKIAKAKGEDLSKDISSIQLTISERFSKVQSAFERGNVNAKIQKQIKPMLAEVEEGKATVDSLVSQGSFVKAHTLARELQNKIYNAELILAGKKPVS